MSESAKIPAQLQAASSTSLIVQASPSSQAAPSVLQLSQPSGVPSPSESTLSSKPGQISSASQTPSLSESAKVPAQLQSVSSISFVVQALPSLQAAPGVLQLSQPSGVPSPSLSTLSSKPGQISLASQTPSLSESAKVPAQLQSVSSISLVVQALPSLQAAPGVLQLSQPSGVPSPSVSTLSSKPRQISLASQTPSLSESAKVPTQLQAASSTSLIVQASPSSQAAPGVLQLSHHQEFRRHQNRHYHRNLGRYHWRHKHHRCQSQ